MEINVKGSLKSKKEVKIVLLGVGEYFGIEEILKNNAANYTIKCSSNLGILLKVKKKANIKYILIINIF